jgi:signal peptidase I
VGSHPIHGTNDRVFTEKVSYHVSDPEPGDVVVFDDPNGGEIPLVKRVIATAGQTVDILDEHMLIDGVELPEPYLNGVKTIKGTVDLPLTVPADEIWVMGDNRPNSFDSRFFGTVPVSAIQGRALAIYWPLDHIRSMSVE